MKKLLIYFSILFSLVYWHRCAFSSQNNVILVEKNQPKAVILVRSDATWLETTAAEDLAIYIAKSTDAYLNIKSFVEYSGSDLNQIRIGVAGEKPFENIKPGTIPYQGFKIVSQGNRIDLIGSTMQGASNAVYWLLRNKLGVEWYMPTELGEEITTTDKIALGEFTVVKEPSFICIRRATGRQLELERYGIRHYDTVKYVVPGAGNIDYGFNHNWYKIVPLTPENYYKHSEWFSLAKGRKVDPRPSWDKRQRADYQVCTTNPQVKQMFIDAAIEHFTSYPERNIFSLSPNDGPQICGCRQCLALDKKLGVTAPPYTDRLLYFFNEIAEEVVKIFPDKYLGFHAYWDWAKPPKVVKPHSMIVPILCPWGNFCYRHGIDDPTCLDNKKWKETNFNKWVELCDTVAYYGYWGSSGSWRGPYPSHVDRDLPFIQTNGVAILTDDTRRDWATNAPYYYLFHRVAWDTSSDLQQVYRDFCSGMYGPAKEPMLEYWMAWNKSWSSSGHGHASSHDFENIFTPELINEQWKLIHAAEKLVANAPERYKERIKLARYGLEYTEHMLNSRRYKKQGKHLAAESELKEAIGVMLIAKSLSGPPAFSHVGEPYNIEDRWHGRELRKLRTKTKNN